MVCVGNYIEVTVYNTDCNDHRCAGGIVRVLGRCLGAVGSQSLRGCETDEVHTRGKDVVAAGFTTKSAWRGLSNKKSDNVDNSLNADNNSFSYNFQRFLILFSSFSCFFRSFFKNMSFSFLFF